MYRYLKKLLTGVLSLTVLCAAAMPSMALDGTGNAASVGGQEYATVQEAIDNGDGKGSVKIYAQNYLQAPAE